MKVLLINPPRNLKNYKKQFFAAPLGLAYLAAYLREKGFSVGLIDAIAEGSDDIEPLANGIFKCGLSNENLKARIHQFNPDVIGISCMFTPRFNNVAEIARMVKDIDSRIKVVVGGIHVSACPEESLKERAIDFVVLGEGEIPFYNLLKKLDCRQTDFTDICGIAFCSNGKAILNSKQNFIDDLDMLPLPARDLLPMERYFEINSGRDSLTRERRQTSMITSRGCPYNCTFCSAITFWGRNWRKRSAENVLEEIECLIRVYKIKEISFEDDNMSLDPVRLEQICQGIIKRNLKFRWNTPNGIAVHNLSRPLISLMKQSGCQRLNFGIESGDDYILNTIIRKNISLDKIRKVVGWCKEEGIITLGYFVLGMPGENPKTIRNTIEFAKSINLNEIGIFIATPFPGTELYRICKEKNYLKHDYNDILAEDEIENEILFETPFLSADDVIKYKSLFYSEFYRAKALKNPLYYFSRIIKNPSVALRYVKELMILHR